MLVKINVTLFCNFLQWIAKLCILYNNWINCFRLAQLVEVFGSWVFFLMIGKIFFNQQRWHLPVGTVMVIHKVWCVSTKRSWKCSIIPTASSWNGQDTNTTKPRMEDLILLPFSFNLSGGRSVASKIVQSEKKAIGPDLGIAT